MFSADRLVEVHMRLSLIVPIILMAFMLGGCLSGSDSSSPAAATTTTQTWPPRTFEEFISFADGKVFTRVDYPATIRFDNGVFRYIGLAGSYHIATVFTSNTTNYQTQMVCDYSADTLSAGDYSLAAFTLTFDVTSTTDFEPGGIQNCRRPNCPTVCNPMESVYMENVNERNCFRYLGELFCTQ